MKLLNILLATAFFSIIGLFIYSQFYGGYLVKFRYEATAGKIISSEVEQIEQEEECGEYCTKTVTAFRPKLLYEYQIGKIKYFGTRYRAFSRGEDKLWAAGIVKEHPPGKEITVFYNPGNPERSVLSKDTPKTYWEKLFFIILVLILISIAYYRDSRSSNNQEKPFHEGFENITSKFKI